MSKIRFGVVGLGNMGGFHTGYMDKLEHATLAAVCDNDPARLNPVAAKFPNAAPFDNAQSMIDSGKIDAVLIATPHYFHGPIARAAFAKGLHVLMEKPAAVSVADARATNDAFAKTKGLSFGIVFQQRTVPAYIKLRQLIADGELGEISRVTWLVTDWFRTWAYYASGGWRATWAGEGGGVLINQCPHNLDLLQWITGLMPSRITAVASLGKTHPIEVEDEVSAILEYPNGAIGHFVTTTGEAPGTNRLEICGDRGRIIAEGGKLAFKRNTKLTREVREKSTKSFDSIENWDIDVPYHKGPEGHQLMTENFLRNIKTGEPLIAPGIEGVRGLEIGNAILMAGVTRKPVELPLDGKAYDAFIADMIKTYGGKKTLATKAASADMGASFAKV